MFGIDHNGATVCNVFVLKKTGKRMGKRQTGKKRSDKAKVAERKRVVTARSACAQAIGSAKRNHARAVEGKKRIKRKEVETRKRKEIKFLIDSAFIS